MNIVSRSESGLGPRLVTTRIPLPGRLWLHHTAGSGHGKAGLLAIQKFHIEQRQLKDIAYSLLVDDLDQTVYEGRGVGYLGGHTRGDNDGSSAICVMGNFDVEQPKKATIAKVAELVRYGVEQGWWAGLTGGHREAPGATTACPGTYLFSRIPEIRQLAATPTQPPQGYKMLVFGRPGTADARTAVAAYRRKPVGVWTLDLAEAQAAIRRGEKVVGIGGPACVDLFGAAKTGNNGYYLIDGKHVACKGVNGAETRTLAFALADRGWKVT